MLLCVVLIIILDLLEILKFYDFALEYLFVEKNILIKFLFY